MTSLYDESQIEQALSEFVNEEVKPAAAQAEQRQEFPEQVWEGLADLGLTGMLIAEEHGGIDVDLVTYSIANEELARGHLSVSTALSVHCGATLCIQEYGRDEQRAAWLPRLSGDGAVAAFALTEPQAGSNPAEISAEAHRDGDEYVINGTKRWVTNGNRSDVIIVFAKTGDGDADGITQFLVPTDSDGVRVEKREDKLGLRAIDTPTFVFEDVRIPATHRLTEVGQGLKSAFAVINIGRIAIASQAVGIAQAAYDEARGYAADREQFGKPIAEHQAIAHKLAEMQTNVQAARLLARDAATRNDGGTDRVAASMAKYFAGETAVDVADEAVQIHGGNGFTKEYDVERYYRDAKVTTIYEGTSEIQKEVISRHTD